jgi:hypothetical protein
MKRLLFAGLILILFASYTYAQPGGMMGGGYGPGYGMGPGMMGGYGYGYGMGPGMMGGWGWIDIPSKLPTPQNM